ncbi:hypothetical protein [Pseudoroseicyclus aestuarii]|uniref:Flagellar FliJ protein n=1 Tax=Pseudoroseicyclus aestuarii TaxID=1795041 RepID=A0A318SW52_9RHOB|nr:hypothetical protein [Pseudoroseicyclus aestuarii]PYE84586.1 hypothetical protein DFP88_102387 [Pseudoroseicyclus aestuarii]
MSRADDLAALRRLTGAVFDAAQGRMAALRRRDAEIGQALETLSEQLRERALEVRADDLAHRAGADQRWQHWIDTRRTSLNMERARLRAEIAGQETELRKAFGRREAAKDLFEAEARARRQAAQRKEDR